MSGYDEAVAWFRHRAGGVIGVEGEIATSGAAKAHAATIVRAALAEAVPAGRDLTAQDVRDSFLLVLERGAPDEEARQFVADFLSRIARPSGGVGQQWECIHPELDGPCSGCSPRSWSLPAPPPDDVTVVHLRGDGMRCERKGEYWVNPYGGELTWGELFSDGFTVVEGEPPAPEPQAAERGRDLTYRDLEDAWVNVPGVTTAERRDRAVDHLNRIARPAAEPPRFERGFYRLARDLDSNGYHIADADTTVAVVGEQVDEHAHLWLVMPPSGVTWTCTAAALAAAGAVRVEER